MPCAGNGLRGFARDDQPNSSRPGRRFFARPARLTGPAFFDHDRIHHAAQALAELARMAREAQVPISFVGKAYGSDDAYGKEFSELVDDRLVLLRGHISDRTELIGVLRSSRGFVIHSCYENWCLSAHEAAACGLPVLLPDLPWARECFGKKASYLHAGERQENVARLRAFYDQCPNLPAPGLKFYSWDEVAGRLVALYKSLLGQ